MKAFMKRLWCLLVGCKPERVGADDGVTRVSWPLIRVGGSPEERFRIEIDPCSRCGVLVAVQKENEKPSSPDVPTSGGTVVGGTGADEKAAEGIVGVGR